MPSLHRYIVGPNDSGKSAVLETQPSNIQSKEGFFWRSTLWATQEFPVDNSIDGDRALDSDIGARREPFPNGMLVRALQIWPDEDLNERRRQFDELNEQVGQKHIPTDADAARHPTMHRTDTLDCITCVQGEIYVITDVDEVLMTPGDTVVIRGTNHGWSNRSAEPCLLVGSMMAAVPQDAIS